MGDVTNIRKVNFILVSIKMACFRDHHLIPDCQIYRLTQWLCAADLKAITHTADQRT